MNNMIFLAVTETHQEIYSLFFMTVLKSEYIITLIYIICN